LSTPFHKELVARDPRPPPGRPLSSASADAKALARRTSWWLPGDLTLSRSSPPGKKNFRGAARLRQIEVGYNLLPQVRRDVTDHRHPVSRFARQERRLRHSPSGASRGHRISPDVQAQRRRRTAYSAGRPEIGRIIPVRPPPEVVLSHPTSAPADFASGVTPAPRRLFQYARRRGHMTWMYRAVRVVRMGWFRLWPVLSLGRPRRRRRCACPDGRSGSDRAGGLRGRVRR
jgi:hypothetical protein